MTAFSIPEKMFPKIESLMCALRAHINQSLKEYNKCLNFVYIKYVCAILKLGTPCEYPVYNTCNGAA